MSGNTATAVGGGIYFTNGNGTVTITDSTVSNNTAVSGFGGGIANLGAQMTITNSTISGNTAGGVGGGIDNFVGSGGQLTITNSTLSGNSAANRGGAIYNYAPLTLTNVTLSGNSAPEGGSLYVFSTDFTPSLSNILIANSLAGGNCAGFTQYLTDAGYNLSSDGTCNLTSGTSLPNTNPLLGSLADNGGPTQTHALLAGSPAVDRIPQGANGCGTTITTDQRGVARPQGSGCDIGAYEAEPERYTLTVSKEGAGSGTVTSIPAGIDCGVDCGKPYSAGTVLTLTATADPGSTFAGWSGDADCSDGQVTMNAHKSCTATFNITQYTLTVTKSGPGTGTVTAGANCTLNWVGNTGTCTANYVTGITLTAAPAAGSTFTGWRGGTGSASVCSGIGDCIFNITADSAVTAAFTLLQNLPDLTGHWSVFPTQTCGGRVPRCRIQGELTVQNIGSANAPNSKVRFYLRDNDLYIGLAEKSVKRILPGRSIKIYLDVRLAAGLSASGKFIIAMIDADNSVTESNETNNIIIWPPQL